MNKGRKNKSAGEEGNTKSKGSGLTQCGAGLVRETLPFGISNPKGSACVHKVID